mmetsp:Transcript_89182/g.171652  ORF Transcript_89182/g.171652 Transcript_89182/m.171652 type:complete len:245 (+) Transcript_89182:76-810(+)
MSRDYYEIIGVNSSATQKEISKAFRAQARKLHPDKVPQGSSETTKQQAKKAFQDLARAYEVLGDEQKRADYNLSRPVPGSKAQAHAREHPQNNGARPGTWFEEEDEYWKKKEEREEAREQERKERQGHVYTGLGGHWVKPAPPPANNTWSGWRQSGGTPKHRTADDDSDVSSTLSFDIGINLRDLDLKDLKMEEDSGTAPAEVWTFTSQDDNTGNSSGAQDGKANILERKPDTTQKQPACCIVS